MFWDETLQSAHDVKRSVRYRYRPQTQAKLCESDFSSAEQILSVRSHRYVGNDVSAPGNPLRGFLLNKILSP
nr:MAG TPA: hypothetical protein [Caudoviricetes sp.]